MLSFKPNTVLPVKKTLRRLINILNKTNIHTYILVYMYTN